MTYKSAQTGAESDSVRLVTKPAAAMRGTPFFRFDIAEQFFGAK